MYIKRILIENIRSLSLLEWELQENPASGWHVIIGDNSAGKSTFLQAIALGLLGPVEGAILNEDWNAWIQWGANQGQIKLNLVQDDKTDKTETPLDEDNDFRIMPLNREKSYDKQHDKMLHKSQTEYIHTRQLLRVLYGRMALED